MFHFSFFVYSFLLAFASIGTAHAQTPITDEMTEAFYHDCVRIENEEMSAGTHDIFCQCTAQKMQENLSVEDVHTMRGNGQSARNALNDMMIKVYAPCMEFPVHDLIYNRCMKEEMRAKKGICGCLAGKMSAYTAQTAQETLGDVLKKNPNITDPMEPIVNSGAFARTEKKLVLECIQGR